MMAPSTPRITAVHILPNVISPIIVASTPSEDNVIHFESVLSFLGDGLQDATEPRAIEG